MCQEETARNAEHQPRPPRRPRPRKDQAGAVSVHSKVYFLGFPNVVCKDVGARRQPSLQAPSYCVCVCVCCRVRLELGVRESLILRFI